MQNSQSDMQNIRGGKGGSLGAIANSARTTLEDLHMQAPVSGLDYSIMALSDEGEFSEVRGFAPNIAVPNDCVLHGVMQVDEVDASLKVHSTHGLVQGNWRIEMTLPAGLIYCFLGAGRLSFDLDGRRYKVDTRKANQSENCFIVNLTKPARLIRTVMAGEKIQKLNITATPSWFDSGGGSGRERSSGLASMLQQLPHGKVLMWQASDLLASISVQLLGASQQRGIVEGGRSDCKVWEHLYERLLQGQSTHCLAVALHECRSLWLPTGDRCALQLNHQPLIPGGRECRQAQSRFLTLMDRYVQDFSKAELSRPSQPNIQAIANEMGMSVSAVQRLSQKLFGESLVHYIRQKKLGRARRALENGEVSIGEAAYLAGYKHASNFAIAFKKAFGISPGVLVE